MAEVNSIHPITGSDDVLMNLESIKAQMDNIYSLACATVALMQENAHYDPDALRLVKLIRQEADGENQTWDKLRERVQARH